MSDAVETNVRRGWLKLMYAYTIIGAGGFGLALLLIPEKMRSVFGWSRQDPVLFGAFISVLIAFALLSVFGLKAPLKYVPILFLQLVYKLIWFVVILLPAASSGSMPLYRILLAVIFASYVAGDLIAIPFRYLFEQTS